MKTKTKESFTLTEEQKRLVEDNHNLIYSFLNKYHYPEEEFYDLAAIGLCYAAHSYNPNAGAFSTYAYQAMRVHILKHFVMTNRQCRIPESQIISLDKSYSEHEDDPCTILDFLEDEVNIEEEVISYLDYTKFYQLQTPNNQNILDGFMNGATVKEIAKENGCSTTYINYVRHLLRERYKQCYSIS